MPGRADPPIARPEARARPARSRRQGAGRAGPVVSRSRALLESEQAARTPAAAQTSAPVSGARDPPPAVAAAGCTTHPRSPPAAARTAQPSPPACRRLLGLGGRGSDPPGRRKAAVPRSGPRPGIGDGCWWAHVGPRTPAVPRTRIRDPGRDGGEQLPRYRSVLGLGSPLARLSRRRPCPCSRLPDRGPAMTRPVQGSPADRGGTRGGPVTRKSTRGRGDPSHRPDAAAPPTASTAAASPSA